MQASDQDNSIILEAKNLTMRFGGLTAVKDFNLRLRPKQLAGIIGPNGAGKTTIFNMITGIYTPSEGQVHVAGRNVTGMAPYKIAAFAVARTFQNIRLFKDMTVWENVKLASHHNAQYNFFQAILRTKKFHQEEERIAKKTLELLKIFNLQDKKDHLAKNLSYGQQRRLEMARALATDPKVLLLDEPAAGMNPQETKELTSLIRWVRDQFGVAIWPLLTLKLIPLMAWMAP